jgi:betaine-aldehyde dehydrogenase
MDVRDKIFIGGAWVDSSGSGSIEVLDSSTEQPLGSVPDGSAEDVDRAVAAARAAFPAWAGTSRDERLRLLARAGELLAAREEEIAALISREVGMPLTLSVRIQVGLPLGVFASLKHVVEEITWEERIGNSLVILEPIGVVGAITPWNYPLYQAALKCVHAIAAGCTVVLKPSEVAPLDAYVFAEAFEAAGLPAGVFNLVMGRGPVVGEAMAAHPDIDAISFTGSTRAGTRVMAVAAETVKRVGLELGGKSANIILDDADLARAVPTGVAMCYTNSGQTCTAHTRMIVPRSRLAEVEELAAAAAASFTLGEPFSAESRLGPLVSAAQRERVRGYIRSGIDEGAKLLTGGPEAPEGLETGFFVKPTVFSEVSSKMTIAQEEIFGPVLSIIPVDSEEEAIEVANDSIYGLSGAVWSADPARAEAVARRMQTGQVDINGGAFNSEAPFGGVKRSGNGRERGRYGMLDFLETKSLQL